VKTDLRRTVPATAILILAVAACGGGGASTAPGGGASVDPVGSSDAGPSAAAPTEPQAGASVTTAPGGGSTAGVCDLVTVSELEGILGLSPVTTEAFPGASETCDIQADGAPIGAFVLTRVAGPYVYDAFAGDAGSTAISGLGDKAAFNPNQGLLVIAKGDGVLSIAVYDDGTKSEAERVELMKAIGSIAAGRM
jgi:hypothetical protein